VRDDGAGVNLADVRARALAQRLVSVETARAADDATLLALLFVPGFSTKEGADLLAGRGVGLDLTLEAVHRLGGTIRLASERGMGLTATLDVPFEPGLVRVLWVDADDSTYAVPARDVGKVLLARDVPHVPLLAALLGAARKDPAPHELAIELVPDTIGAKRTLVAVAAVGAVEEVALRSVAPLVRTAGPFSGAILRGDELRLCLDAGHLAELAEGHRG
jgi:two-component system chemotaxis sensor kinase CheA